MEHLERAYEEALGRFDGRNFESLSERDKILVTIYGLEAEVNNGGFNQYFFNEAGDGWHYAEQALRTIGAHAMAEIVARAIRVFGEEGPPRDWMERRDMTVDLSPSDEKQLDDLDTAFYAYPDDIAALLEAYLGRA